MKEFSSPGAFARYLTEMKAKLPAAKKEGLESAAKLVEAEIKEEMGHYQGAINGLPEWQQLAERTQTSRAKRGYEPNNPLVVTGHLRESIKHTVHDDHAEIGSSDPIMAYQEFGTPDAKFPIPPRPVVGGSLFRRADDAVKAAVKPTIKLLEGK